MKDTASVSIEDVANYCGVSVSSVYRVLNQTMPVSQKLSQKVTDAIKELGFVPKQAKPHADTETILMLVPELMNPFYIEVVNGAQTEAYAQGFDLVFVNISENPERHNRYLGLLKHHSFDGLIVVGTKLLEEDLIRVHKQYQIPIVAPVRAVEIPHFPCVMADTKIAAYQVVKYLISLNHKKIAYISGPPAWNSSQIRLEHTKRALSEAELSLPETLYGWCYPTMDEGLQAANAFMALPEDERPTAIVTFNDLIAIGVLRAVRMTGLRVPDDISVVGFDDIAMTAYTAPPLTTVAQPKFRLGQEAVQKLARLMRGDVEMGGGSTLLECPLVLRESVAPCFA